MKPEQNDRIMTLLIPKTSRLMSVFSLAALMVTGTVWGQTTESHSTIRATVESFLLQQHTENKENTEIVVGNLDNRLKLVKCKNPLQAYLPPGGRVRGNISVGVRCQGERPWSIYVTARVNQYAEVYVVTNSRARGESLSQADTTLKRTNISLLNNGYVTDFKDVKGKILKRTVSPGTVLTSTMLYRPDLIKRGERVSILARTNSIEIRMRGESLSGGAVGEKIRVKNLSTNKIVEGTITSDGNVEVRL